MTTYSSNILLTEPTPGDPAFTNTWGATLNTNFSLIDSAVAGIITIGVGGSSNVVLTSNQGSADQSRNQQFNFTGVLTGNIYVLWPNGLDRMFSVTNNTTGAFTLSCGVTNGAGLPVGVSVAVAQSDTTMLYSNGTDVKQRAPSVNEITFPVPIASGGTGQTTASTAINALLPSQTGNNGKVLTTNGSSASWGIGKMIGEIFIWPGSSLPSLCIYAAGQAISRSTYSGLFSVYSTTYGSGDGSTTFNVPDMRGRAPFGRDDMGGSASNRITNAISGITGTSLGAAGGSQSMQSHTHTASVTDPGHNHPIPFAVTSGGVGTFTVPSAAASKAQASTTGATTGIGVTNATTGSGASQNMPPAIILNFVIYAGA